jgi:hypothetical protein
MWKFGTSPDPPLATGDPEPPDGKALGLGAPLAWAAGGAEAEAEARG